MEYAYGEGKPPPELKLGWQCERWNCLPEAGAYLDQDYGLIHRMTVFMNIYNVIQRWKNATGKSIHTLTDSERVILRWLKDIGIMFQ